MIYENNGLENSVAGAYEEGMDSLQHQEHVVFSNDGYYRRLLREAAHYYDQMSSLRKKWTRANDFFMGRQLNDKVTWQGREMRVADVLKLRGLPEFQNDIISDKVMTLKGLLRQEDMAPTCKATDANEDMYVALFSEFLRKNDQLNDMAEQSAELFENFCKYAFLCAKVSYTYRDGREDVYVDIPDIYKLAVPAWEKSNLSDIRFIAEAHDMSWPDLLESFCYDENGNASRRAEEALKDIYARQSDHEQSHHDTGMDASRDSDDFYHSTVVGKYRVIEIWKLERNRALWCHDRATGEPGFRPLSDKPLIDAENARRLADNIIKDEAGVPVLDAAGQQQYYIAPGEVQLIDYQERIEQFWYYRFLSPNGYLLKEGVSPYRVMRNGYGFYIHPYVFRAYPGKETRSFIDRTEDKQNATNHYMLMLDSILGHSLKGMAYDAASLSEYQTIEEMVYQSTKPNGVVIYDSRKGGEAPKPLATGQVPSGLEWMIQQNQGLVVTQSGVQGALQGVHRSTSGRQYQIEKQSASTTVADYFGVFYSFRKQIAMKQLWLIQEFYDSHRSVQLTGEDVRRYFNSDTMSDIGVEVSLEMDVNSAVMREANNDMLWQLMLQNKIDLITMLDCGAWTHTARLKKAYLELQQRMAEAQAGVAASGQNAVNGSQSSPGSNGGNGSEPAVVTPMSPGDTEGVVGAQV